MLTVIEKQAKNAYKYVVIETQRSLLTRSDRLERLDANVRVSASNQLASIAIAPPIKCTNLTCSSWRFWRRYSGHKLPNTTTGRTFSAATLAAETPAAGRWTYSNLTVDQRHPRPVRISSTIDAIIVNAAETMATASSTHTKMERSPPSDSCGHNRGRTLCS